MPKAEFKDHCSNMPDYSIGQCFVKTETGAIYKIIAAKYFGKVYNQKRKEWANVNDWLYDCETVHGDERRNVRIYQHRINKEYYQVPNDSEAVQAIYG